MGISRILVVGELMYERLPEDPVLGIKRPASTTGAGT